MIKIDYNKYCNKDFKSKIEEYKNIFVSEFNTYTYIKGKDKKLKKEFLKNDKTSYFKGNTVSLENIFDKYKEECFSSFDSIFEGYTFGDILLLEPEEIISFIESNKNKTNLDNIKYFFKYSQKFDKPIRDFFTKNFDFSVCFYCNKEFIAKFEKKENEFSAPFQLDHFYDKDKYPYLALSFYNLIPSCATCNSSSVKGRLDCYLNDEKLDTYDNEICLAPNHSDFDFDKKTKFKLHFSEKCKDLNIEKKEDINIILKENYSKDYNKYVDIFKLNKRYENHKNIVFDMMKNTKLYSDSRLKELEKLTGVPYHKIKKDIFNLLDKEEDGTYDLSKEPFSKLIKDISEELDLI